MKAFCQQYSRARKHCSLSLCSDSVTFGQMAFSSKVWFLAKGA